MAESSHEDALVTMIKIVDSPMILDGDASSIGKKMKSPPEVKDGGQAAGASGVTSLIVNEDPEDLNDLS